MSWAAYAHAMACMWRSEDNITCMGGPLYHVGPESGSMAGALHTGIPFQPLIHNFKKVTASCSVLLTSVAATCDVNSSRSELP